MSSSIATTAKWSNPSKQKSPHPYQDVENAVPPDFARNKTVRTY